MKPDDEVPAVLLPHVEGAWEKGTPVRKANSRPGDIHPDGSPGEVVASVDVDGAVGYFVDFAPPRVCPEHGIPDCSPLLNGCGRLTSETAVTFVLAEKLTLEET